MDELLGTAHFRLKINNKVRTQTRVRFQEESDNIPILNLIVALWKTITSGLSILRPLSKNCAKNKLKRL